MEKIMDFAGIISERASSYGNIIWDWNGTLMDDMNMCVEIINDMLDDHNLAKVDAKRYRDIFGLPIIESYKKMGFSLNQKVFEELNNLFHEQYNERRLICGEIFPYIPGLLEHFSKSKRQSVLSAGAQWDLDEWVKSCKVDHYFEFVFGIDNRYGTSKIQRGMELMQAASYNKEDTILIGDTKHDLEVGNALGIDVLLIANGHQSTERLEKIHDNVISLVP